MHGVAVIMLKEQLCEVTDVEDSWKTGTEIGSKPFGHSCYFSELLSKAPKRQVAATAYVIVIDSARTPPA